MKFKLGDIVGFLNEKGQGIVKRVLKSGIVYVEIEDGFEIPMQENELVLISPSSPIEEFDDVDEELKKHAPNKGIYFLFKPHNVLLLLSSKIDVYLINNTTYHLYYTCSFEQNQGYFLLNSGQVKSYHRMLINTIEKPKAGLWANVKVDTIFYKQGHYEPIEPKTEVLKINTDKLYKESIYVKNDFISDKAYVFPILKYDASTYDILGNYMPGNISNLFLEKEQKQTAKVSKQHTGRVEEEVDLHIEELIDNSKGMTNAQIIQIQLKHFQNRLDAAIANNINKIIFIHGVGNGRLKQEVRQILSTYPGIRYYDASYQRYGFGATEVVLH